MKAALQLLPFRHWGDDEAAQWVRTRWVAPRLGPLLARAAEAPNASLGSMAAVLSRCSSDHKPMATATSER